MPAHKSHTMEDFEMLREIIPAALLPGTASLWLPCGFSTASRSSTSNRGRLGGWLTTVSYKIQNHAASIFFPHIISLSSFGHWPLAAHHIHYPHDYPLPPGYRAHHIRYLALDGRQILGKHWASTYLAHVALSMGGTHQQQGPKGGSIDTAVENK
jgi:hypothetical protein